MFCNSVGIDGRDQVPLKHLKGKHILSMLPQEPTEGEHGKDDHSLQLLRESRQKAIGRSRHYIGILGSTTSVFWKYHQIL